MAECIKYGVVDLNRRVIIQSVTRTSDGQGGYTEVWATFATVWASIVPMKGYEKFQAAKLETPVSHKMMMRYRSGVTTAMRILWGTRVFDIKEVLNMNEDNSFLQIIAIEKA